jgi:micrococcal nuclease
MKLNIKISVVLLCAAALGLFPAAAAGTSVYVTNSGTKYHREDCSSLSRSKIAVSLEDAVHSGYEPCSICKPPVLSKSVGGGTARPQAAGLYRVNVAGLKTSAGADTGQMARAEVVDHVDGDTVRVRITNPPAGLQVVETIRLLGVDTPETVHPNRQVERFGKEASDYTKARLLGKTVRLAFDWDLRDHYGRLLAYIYTDGGAGSTGAHCFNAELVREGYAHAYTRYAFQFADEFLALEREARRTNRGLWGE